MSAYAKWCVKCRRRRIPPHGARYCDPCWQQLFGPRPAPGSQDAPAGLEPQ
jgi:hypothetical protein